MDTSADSDETAESNFHCEAAFALKLKHLLSNSMINTVE